MSVLNDLRLDVGDDGGSIPSGVIPPLGSGLPSVDSTNLLGRLRIDVGDDAGLIPSGALAIHEANPSAHHARYTDAEAASVAAGLITIHAGDSGVHHTRYTDEEAANVAASVLATGVTTATIQESGVELLVDATTTAVLPVLSTLLTTSIDLENPSGCLRISSTAAANANGAVPLVFHVYIDGTFHRGTTINVTGAIDNASIVIPRVVVSGLNPHTIDLRWAKFGSPGLTARCLPVSFPDLYHASLSVQEVL